jgi:hypothetical protein
MNSNQSILEACDRFGAKTVSDAAYRRMNGDHAALAKVGLQNAPNLGEAEAIAKIAFDLMSPQERAEDAANAVISAAKIKPQSNL